MKNKNFLFLASTAVFALAFFLAPAKPTADDFYKGKTIRFIVGYAPGGGYDTYTRAIARHIGKFIPGHPSAVVENMEGAGSLVDNVTGKEVEANVEEILSISPEIKKKLQFLVPGKKKTN